MITRNKTPSKYVCYGLHLYFSGLSLRILEKPLKDYLNCLNEITFPSEIGFKSIMLE
ncbi:MAG: hypothetical protein R2685_12475 [Candidatus Nitrosocosmicus sp.]|nr:hypothetical protein [Candidatus Nitrosocosmicus sp.]